MRRRDARGQATVEVALVLPVVVTVVLLVVQVGLLARDQVLAVHGARAAVRAVSVSGDPAAGGRAAADSGLGDRARVRVAGSTVPGGLAEVSVEVDPVRLPVVGRLLGGLRLRERLAARVEGP